jgi:UDP-N-acetylglucosamine enolpyruvyl transferase
MDVLKIKGGKPLTGTIKAAGAKNAMTKLLVASLLSDKKCTFHNSARKLVQKLSGIKKRKFLKFTLLN